ASRAVGEAYSRRLISQTCVQPRVTRLWQGGAIGAKLRSFDAKATGLLVGGWCFPSTSLIPPGSQDCCKSSTRTEYRPRNSLRRFPRDWTRWYYSSMTLKRLYPVIPAGYVRC